MSGLLSKRGQWSFALDGDWLSQSRFKGSIVVLAAVSDEAKQFACDFPIAGPTADSDMSKWFCNLAAIC